MTGWGTGNGRWQRAVSEAQEALRVSNRGEQNCDDFVSTGGDRNLSFTGFASTSVALCKRPVPTA